MRIVMETLRKSFWKHVSTVGGPSDIKDVFLKWAASNHLNYETAGLLWSNINKEINTAFGKKEADSNLEKLKLLNDILNGTSGESFEKPEESTGLLGEEKDKIEKPGLMDFGTDEDEEESPASESIKTIPPLAGEGTPPPAPTGPPLV